MAWVSCVSGIPDPSSIDVAKDRLLERFFLPPLWFLFFFGTVWEDVGPVGGDAAELLSVGCAVWTVETAGREGAGLAVAPGEGGVDMLRI
jgi:hypothetical protein